MNFGNILKIISKKIFSKLISHFFPFLGFLTHFLEFYSFEKIDYSGQYCQWINLFVSNTIYINQFRFVYLINFKYIINFLLLILKFNPTISFQISSKSLLVVSNTFFPKPFSLLRKSTVIWRSKFRLKSKISIYLNDSCFEIVFLLKICSSYSLPLLA